MLRGSTTKHDVPALSEDYRQHGPKVRTSFDDEVSEARRVAVQFVWCFHQEDVHGREKGEGEAQACP